MATKTAICETAWGCEPRLVAGAEYDLVDSFFANGEGQFTVKSEDQQVFTVPSVFFVFDEAHYE